MKVFRHSARAGIVGVVAPFALLASVSLSFPGAAKEVSFAEKTVTMMINFDVGSTTETFHRQFAPFVAKHLPGQPQMIVDTKPGGAGTLGAAHLAARTKPDGMTVGVLGIVVPQWAVGRQMPVELENFALVGGFGASTIVYTRTDSGIRSAEQFKDPPVDLLIGAVSPQAPGIVPLRLFLHAISQRDNYQMITGYRGQLAMLQALRANEINVTFQNSAIYMPRADGYKQEGIVHPLMEYGVLGPGGGDAPTAGLDLPLMEDVWRKIAPDTVGGPEHKAWRMLRDANQLNFLYALPPGTPDDLTQVWSDAFAAAFQDGEFQDLLRKQDHPSLSTVNGPEATRMLRDITQAIKDPDVQAALRPIAAGN